MIMKVQYPAERVVSIWIGTFSDENEMDRCTDEVIEPDLKLECPLSSTCEVAFVTDLVPVSELLEGFSGWEAFVDEASAVAALNGVSEANGALVCYYLRCDASPHAWPGVVYLGTFEGDDVM
jgi:hypothetical protein